MWQLQIKQAHRPQREPLMLKAGQLSIGRAPECDLVLDSPLVAPHHADLRVEADHLLLHDRGSGADSRVNGERIGTVPVSVSDGGRIEIGDVVILLHRVVAAPTAEELSGSVASQFEQQVRGIQHERDRYQQAQRAERQRFEQDWLGVIAAATDLRERIGQHPRLLYFVISRDQHEIAVKLTDHSSRGHRNLILSRRHPDKDVEMDGTCWFAASDEPTRSFRDPKEALAELVHGLAAALA